MENQSYTKTLSAMRNFVYSFWKPVANIYGVCWRHNKGFILDSHCNCGYYTFRICGMEYKKIFGSIEKRY